MATQEEVLVFLNSTLHPHIRLTVSSKLCLHLRWFGKLNCSLRFARSFTARGS